MRSESSLLRPSSHPAGNRSTVRPFGSRPRSSARRKRSQTPWSAVPNRRKPFSGTGSLKTFSPSHFRPQSSHVLICEAESTIELCSLNPAGRGIRRSSGSATGANCNCWRPVSIMPEPSESEGATGAALATAWIGNAMIGAPSTSFVRKGTALPSRSAIRRRVGRSNFHQRCFPDSGLDLSALGSLCLLFNASSDAPIFLMLNSWRDRRAMVIRYCVRTSMEVT
jgi:hypothetical protein